MSRHILPPVFGRNENNFERLQRPHTLRRTPKFNETLFCAKTPDIHSLSLAPTSRSAPLRMTQISRFSSVSFISCHPQNTRRIARIPSAAASHARVLLEHRTAQRGPPERYTVGRHHPSTKGAHHQKGSTQNDDLRRTKQATNTRRSRRQSASRPPKQTPRRSAEAGSSAADQAPSLEGDAGKVQAGRHGYRHMTNTKRAIQKEG